MKPEDWATGPLPVPSRRSRSLTAANVAITDQILAVLAEEAPLPVSTSHILNRLGLRGYQNTVLRLLNRLAKLGEVEKWPADPDRRCCYWRRLTPAEAAEAGR